VDSIYRGFERSSCAPLDLTTKEYADLSTSTRTRRRRRNRGKGRDRERQREREREREGERERERERESWVLAGFPSTVPLSLVPLDFHALSFVFQPVLSLPPSPFSLSLSLSLSLPLSLSCPGIYAFTRFFPCHSFWLLFA